MPATGQKLYRLARKRIPGGTQLLSKRPEMLLPEQWPTYYSRASGSKVWDLDDNQYIDMSYSGIGSCILGYADPDVNAAVHAAIESGSMSTLNCAEEMELADLLCEIHPWAEMVRYARCGGEAMAIAVRIARAHARRDKVAFCGYHGWHDWYLAANIGSDDALEGHLLPGLAPNGVPRQLAGTAFPFHYNRIDELKAIVQAHGKELAAIVMEPIRNQDPQDDFLQKVCEIANQNGSVLIFDEVTSAWRLNSGGAHLLYNVLPDIAVFAKAISNGYPMAAIIGTGEVMQAAQESFISSTYWTERTGSAAALATIRKHQSCDVSARLLSTGKKIQDAWKSASERTGLALSISGIPPLSHFSLQVKDAQAVRTLFTQLMLERGFLASNAFYATYAQSDEDINKYSAAVMETFGDLIRAIDSGTVMKLLKGPIAHVGFSRLT
jgi:glutamate-1-semialdehyde 2,1-aminomutase